MPLVCYVSELEKNVSLDAERLLRLLGVSGKLSGFHFAVYMLEQVQEKPEYVLLITKRLYSQMAQYFHTTANCVERKAVFYFNLLVQFYSCTDIKKWLNDAGFCKFALRQINESYRKELLYPICFLLYLISFPKSYGI